MDQSGRPDMMCPICGVANCACGGPAKLKYPPVGWEGEWPDVDNEPEQENSHEH